MKKTIFIVFSILLLVTCFTTALNSQIAAPVIDEINTVVPDNTKAVLKEVETVTNVKLGDDAENVNKVINNQNNIQANAATKPTNELKTALENNGQKLPDNAYIVGRGFMEINVVDLATGEDTGRGLTFSVHINEISNTTEDVGLIHYSSQKGFEYVKANSFNTSTKMANFTLKDTSPIAFTVSYKTGDSSSNSSAPSVPTSNREVVNTGV